MQSFAAAPPHPSAAMPRGSKITVILVFVLFSIPLVISILIYGPDL